jgi:hypothetical protein
MMSHGKACDCRKYLVKQGLIIGRFKQDPGYPQPVWHLTIPNLWKANLEWCEAHPSIMNRIEFKKSRHQVTVESENEMREPSPGDGGVSPGDGGVSPGDGKNNHKEDPKEKPPRAGSPPAKEIVPDILPLREERSGKDIALAHRESTARALARGIEGYANDPTGIDLNGYPVDVVDIIRYTCKEWGLRPPYRKGDKAKWIEDARALKHACGEFGMDPINEERQRVVEYMEQHQGVAPYTYKDLGSLVGSVGGLAARKRLAPKSNGNGNGLDELTRTGLDYLNNNGPRGRLTPKILADLRGKYGDAWLVEHGVTWASKVLPGNGQVTPIMP